LLMSTLARTANLSVDPTSLGLFPLTTFIISSSYLTYMYTASSTHFCSTPVLVLISLAVLSTPWNSTTLAPGFNAPISATRPLPMLAFGVMDDVAWVLPAMKRFFVLDRVDYVFPDTASAKDVSLTLPLALSLTAASLSGSLYPFPTAFFWSNALILISLPGPFFVSYFIIFHMLGSGAYLLSSTSWYRR